MSYRVALAKIKATPNEYGKFNYAPDITRISDPAEKAHSRNFIQVDMNPESPDYGIPKFLWCLCVVKEPDDIEGEELFVFPDFNYKTATVGDVPANKRQKMNQFLTNRGYDTSWIGLSTKVWEVVLDVLHALTNRSVSKDSIKNKVWTFLKGVKETD